MIKTVRIQCHSTIRIIPCKLYRKLFLSTTKHMATFTPIFNHHQHPLTDEQWLTTDAPLPLPTLQSPSFTTSTPSLMNNDPLMTPLIPYPPSTHHHSPPAPPHWHILALWADSRLCRCGLSPGVSGRPRLTWTVGHSFDRSAFPQPTTQVIIESQQHAEHRLSDNRVPTIRRAQVEW